MGSKKKREKGIGIRVQKGRKKDRWQNSHTETQT